MLTSAMDRFVEVSSVSSFINENKNKNTADKTKQDINLFKSFLQTKGEDGEVFNIAPPVLDGYLGEFFISVRKKDGKEFEPTTLRSYLASIDRHCKENGYPKSLVKDHEFSTSRAALKSKQKDLKRQGKGNKPNAADGLCKDDIKRLYVEKELGPFSPNSLINTMWLNNNLFFGMRGCQEHREMRWGDVQLKQTTRGVEYLVFSKERQTKTRSGEDPFNTRDVLPKAFSADFSKADPNTLNRKDVETVDSLDPVAMYKLYASKRPVTMRGEEDPFYLAINVRKSNDSVKPWFAAGPLGVNKLNSIMKRMAEKCELQGRFTNHTGRKTMMQELVNNDVHPTKIVQLSGHKNIRSVNNYSKMNGEQQQQMSGIISNLTDVHDQQQQPKQQQQQLAPSSLVSDEVYERISGPSLAPVLHFWGNTTVNMGEPSRSVVENRHKRRRVIISPNSSQE
jgi:hypothetical protein